MPVINPTATDGAHSRSALMTYVDTAGTTAPTRGTFLAEADVDGPFVADMLSDMLAHERGGRRLYVSIAGRTHNEVLRQQYQHFGDETMEHAEILENLIGRLGGDPMYVSPSARATEKTNLQLLESTFLLGGSVDLMTQELVMLNAVLLAETVDHSNWSCLSDLTERMQSGDVRQAFQEAVDRVEDQEDEHLRWAQDMRARMLSTLASGATSIPEDGSRPEEQASAIGSLFR